MVSYGRFAKNNECCNFQIYASSTRKSTKLPQLSNNIRAFVPDTISFFFLFLVIYYLLFGWLEGASRRYVGYAEVDCFLLISVYGIVDLEMA